MTTISVNVSEAKRTLLITINSTQVDTTKFAAFEAILYGTAATNCASHTAAVPARLPLPDEIATLLDAG